MDARSIAATAKMGGVLTAATDIEYQAPELNYIFDAGLYEKRVYNGYQNPEPDYELRLGPGITDWPEMPALEENLLVQLCAVIHDEVTTTDELIPSGETSSYRSNPVGLAEFTLSRRAPEYVGLSKTVRDIEEGRRKGNLTLENWDLLNSLGAAPHETSIGSSLFAKKPGDGSAREQAASCQKVLGGFANICFEYATKRYRSNCINWGIVPLTLSDDSFGAKVGDWIYIEGIRSGILSGKEEFEGKLVTSEGIRTINLRCAGLTPEEREILTDGCLMNYYAKGRQSANE